MAGQIEITTWTNVMKVCPKKLVIFGSGTSAQVAAACVQDWSNHSLYCFSVEKKFLFSEKLMGKQVIPYETFIDSFSPENYTVFVASGYSDLSSVRTRIYERSVALGFECPTLVNPNVAFSSTVSIGDNCLILDGVNLQPFVEIGNNNFIWSGATICHHSRVGNNCWITAGTTIAGNTAIGDNCFLGAGAIIGNNLTVGDSCFIGAGAIVTKSIPNNTVVIAKNTEIHGLSSQNFLKLIGNHF